MLLRSARSERGPLHFDGVGSFFFLPRRNCPPNTMLPWYAQKCCLARSSLVPLLREALAIDEADVLGAFLSGAGPSVAMLAKTGATNVAGRLSTMYQKAGIEAAVRTLGVDDQGSRVLESGVVRRTV